MKLTQEQREQIAKILGSKLEGRGKCPFCGQSIFQSSDTIWKMEEFMKPREDQSEKRVNLVAEIICKNCGLSLFFNALKAGILTKDESH